jgi:hypothetical protein
MKTIYADKWTPEYDTQRFNEIKRLREVLINATEDFCMIPSDVNMKRVQCAMNNFQEFTEATK